MSFASRRANEIRSNVPTIGTEFRERQPVRGRNEGVAIDSAERRSYGRPPMRQSRFARNFTILALSFALGSCGKGDSPRAILLVTIDTCRADRIGCYGAKSLETPAIDAVAKDGAVFLQATAPVPLTLPSHATILTGQLPARHGVRDNGQSSLPAEAVTIAERFRDAGWSTAAFVSAVPLSRVYGCDQGFDVYDDRFEANASGDPPASEASQENDVAHRLFYDERAANVTTDAALPWLREALGAKQPFFLWVHYFDPHATYQPPEPYASRYGANSYEGEIAFVDAEIGRLLSALGERRDRVTVAITADHGESLGEHDELTHGLFLYESTLRVPLVLAGPGIQRGARLEAPVSLADVAPTLLHAAGLPIPEGLDGTSLLSVLTGSSPPPFVFAECLFPRLHFDWAGLRSVRRGPWKLILAPRPELFDLAADPHEMTDVATKEPALVEELRTAILEYEESAKPLEAQPADDEASRERLEALGYVGGSSTATRDAAIADLWNLGGEDPKDMVGVFNRMQEVPGLLVDRNDEAAEKILDEILARDPENLEALGQLALLRRLQENWNDARRLCEEILRRDPKSTRTRMNLAHALLRLGDREGARRRYEEIVRIDSRHADAWTLLGSLLTEEGRFADGVAALERATSIDPRDSGARASLGLAREGAGDTLGALADYDSALAIDPAEREAAVQKGLLLAGRGDTKGAIATLRVALERRPNDPELLNNLAWILADRGIDPGEALTLARRASAASPSDPSILDTFGWAAVRAGYPGEAIEPLRAALAATGDAAVKAHLGVALAESGNEREGIDLVRAAVRERATLLEIPEVAKWRR